MNEADKWLIDGIVLNAQSPQCVRSGYCCKRAACAFGEWDEIKRQCKFLEGDKPGEYACGIYDDIKDHPDATAISPAFGVGCSSNLNDDRLEILRRRPKNG